MISDISQFEELFKSLSLVSQWSFELFNNKGPVVESGANLTKLPIAREVQGLSERIMRQATSQHVFCQGDYEILGVPVKNERDLLKTNGRLSAPSLLTGTFLSMSSSKGIRREKQYVPERWNHCLRSWLCLWRIPGSLRKKRRI